MEAKITLVYDNLFKKYGPQGWWPIQRLKNDKHLNITKSGSLNGYHPSNYDLPKSREEVFEVIIGAVLTQNTSWISVEKALLNLYSLNAVNPEKLLKIKEDTLKSAIRPAGYFNQKANYLKEVTKFFILLNGRIPSRNELLKVKGIGNETADSILLYAYKKPEFVVDAYTKRIFSHLGIIKEDAKYMDIKEIFERNLEKDTVVFQEYHALIVEHAKRFYSKKPYGMNDPLRDLLSRPYNKNL
jgi:endonuclease III related protein